MRAPQASFPELPIQKQPHFTYLCERMLRGLFEPHGNLPCYQTHNHKPSLIIKWLPVRREIML